MKNITLETSLKPYYGLEADALRTRCAEILAQWHPLTKLAECVSVLFWAADGSEILDYAGDLDAPMEWARYIGNANAHVHPHIASDPENKSLHARSYLYREDAEKITYRRFAQIIATWREVIEDSGKRARVGLTFDPGGEFAPSSFKYERHREICLADTMGKASFACCYGVLNADSQPYAGFPDGIAQGTRMGTFLGRQFRHLAQDIGADYLWLSNGFGFGMETWKTVGPLFDGETFSPKEAPQLRERILSFWQDFRRECPSLEIETRGTNLGTATDLASDATPLREIYEGEFNLCPPPNSPWAALNGDFGIEIAGYMSRIAELPAGKALPFRFYIHDPWWLNSPWLDRYERQPHDIYLPLATARIDASGKPMVAETLNLLTVDDSWGNTPDSVPLEVCPHMVRAWSERADAAGPFVWLYPFDELHEAMFTQPQRPERLFHTDWFMREAINNGLPVNTVVSTRSLAAMDEQARHELAGRVLITPAPFTQANEQLLIDWLDAGQTLVVYGALDNAPRLRERLRLEQAEPLVGKVTMESLLPALDTFDQEAKPTSFEHRATLSSGGLGERALEGSSVTASATHPHGRRALAAQAQASSGGTLLWLRAPLPLSLGKSDHLPVPAPAGSSYPVAELVREAFAALGWQIRFHAGSRKQRLPVLALHRHANGWYFSGYTPDTTVSFALRTPFGAPLLLGQEIRLEQGHSHFHQMRGWRCECRVFIEQEQGVVSNRAELPGQIGVTRRLWVHGLQDAILRFFPPSDAGEITAWDNPQWPFIAGEKVALRAVATPHGPMLESIEPASGTVLISW